MGKLTFDALATVLSVAAWVFYVLLVLSMDHLPW
jgi:hypothetical protein